MHDLTLFIGLSEKKTHNACIGCQKKSPCDKMLQSKKNKRYRQYPGKEVVSDALGKTQNEMMLKDMALNCHSS